MSKVRPWLFRILVLAAAGFMVVTWLMDWWIADVAALSARGVVIHPWGLALDLSFAEQLVEEANMPGWFAPLMWAYLGICIALLLFSLFAKKKTVGLGKFRLSLPKVIIGGVGLSYIIIAVIGIIFMVIRLDDFFGGVPLNGRIHLDMGEGIETDVITSLKLGYYLMYAPGLVLIALAFLRDKISGRKLT